MKRNPHKIPNGVFLKAILSRKGFDSSFGGCPSPILPDGTLLSLPIPEMKFSSDLKTKEETTNWKTWDKRQYQPIAYSDLALPSSVIEYFKENDVSLLTYLDVLHELLPNGVLREGKGKFAKNLKWTCHLDPDLVPSVMERQPEWRWLFGQGGAAESHLQNQYVRENDLFLFFGWFRKAIIKNGKLLFDPKDKAGVHLIYGYFQVDYKISFSENREKVKSWMNYHPHLRLQAWNNDRNAVYVGKKTLTWDETKPGAGVFQFHPDLVLTDTTTQNNSRRKKTYWRAKLFPKDVQITYHNKNSHKSETDELGNTRKYFKAADKGQEFVFEESVKITEWVEELIDGCKIIH
ncbi:MAG: hypothetical protein HZR80_05015 [Candidatus Heimdallarchaeota archaeon]